MSRKVGSPASVATLAGCLMGCAVGDALGLPYEGMDPRRVRRVFRRPLRHRFVCGRGMLSDDTDHSIFVAQSLVRGRGDAAMFRQALAWRLRLWLLCLPAGIGFATLRSIAKLWLGFSSSGVFSAGNGPSMRSAIIGVYFCTNAEERRKHVEASTLLTHTDPQALAGAMAVAEIAASLAAGVWKERPPFDVLETVLRAASTDTIWQRAVSSMRELSEDPLPSVAEHFGTRRGVTGYTMHSVPFAILAWYRHFGDFRATIEAVIPAGGDVDTVAAIAGALAGSTTGISGVPSAWISGLADWPHSSKYMMRLAEELCFQSGNLNVAFSPALFPRGVLFTLLVLMHGFRRLLS